MPKRRYPKKIRADIERGFIFAYFELVRGLQVDLSETGKVDDVVAMAATSDLLIGMDFSSYYHFSAEMKPQTRLNHLRRKVEKLQRYGQLIGTTVDPCVVLYEVWCFMPPNDYVIQTMAMAQQAGLPAELVDLEELHKRIRQTAEIEPEDKDMISANAFLWSAELFREAGAWKKVE